jgi:hypothetical protein
VRFDEDDVLVKNLLGNLPAEGVIALPEDFLEIPLSNRLHPVKRILNKALRCRVANATSFYISFRHLSVLQIRPVLGARLSPRSTCSRRMMGFRRGGLPMFKTQSQ